MRYCHMMDTPFHRQPLNLLLYSIIVVLFVSCSGRKSNDIYSNTTINGGRVTIAEKFSLTKTDSCTLLTISDPWQGASGIKHVYYLINRDSANSLDIEPAKLVYVPVQKIICMSTTHIAMVAALDERHTIAGVSGSDYVFDEKISALIQKGQISNVGYESGLNNELIIRIAPELIILYGIGSESVGYTAKINELGIKTMFNADYLEENPLGKAEWIKLFGALYCKENLADSIFNSVVESYNKVKELVKKSTGEKPKVLLGLPFRDSWYVSPGNSYVSRLISDAGGDYLWNDTKSTVSMPYGLEDVFMRANDADYWLNIGSVTSKKEILSVDKRLEILPCYINDNLYNNNKRISSGGGNDYWESGALYPNLILKDIATILHPELFYERELFYYKKLE